MPEQNAPTQSGEDQFDPVKMENWTEDKTVDEFNTLPEYTPPPVGIYHFKLVRKDENQPVNPKFDETGKKLQARFHFEIFNSPDPQYNGEIVHQYYTISLNEMSNLRKVVEALIGRPLMPSDKMGWKDGTKQNPDGTISTVVGIGGKMMTATLTHRTSQAGRLYPKLEGFIPYRALPIQPEATPAPAPAPMPIQSDDEADIDLNKVPF